MRPTSSRGAFNKARKLPNLASSRRATSTAVSPRGPGRSKIATSSASDKDSGPRPINFSRGRSWAGHSEIRIDRSLFIILGDLAVSSLTLPSPRGKGFADAIHRQGRYTLAYGYSYG